MEVTEILQSDESLVCAVLGGADPGAFAQLIKRYERVVRGVCLGVLRDDHLASDAAQEAFLAAYQSLAGLRDQASFGMWMTTIARNRAIRLSRKRRRVEPLDSALVQPAATPERDFELLAAIAGLPEQERIVITLRYFDSQGVSEIASILGRPVGTVTKQISRAHQRLRRSLTQEVRR